MTRTTPIILDRLDASLIRHGFRLKRSQLLETAAMAFGYHNSGEFSAAAKAGDLNPPRPDVLGLVAIGGVNLIALRDHTGGVYAIEEDFVEQVVEDERRERFGPSPYGCLVDLSEVAGHPLTAWGRETAGPTVIPIGSAPAQEGTDSMPIPAGAIVPIVLPAYAAGAAATTGERFVLLDAEYNEVARTDDEAKAKEDAMGERAPAGVQDTTDVMIVDLQAREAIHYDWGWRTIALAVEGDPAMLTMAAALAVARVRLEKSQRDHEATLRLDVPDWRAWEKELKKASRKGQEPISDELLHQFRHAIADVHCKSSSSEKSEVEYRQRRYVEKHLGGLIARLDRAEEALRDAGMAPKEIARKSKDDAAERLAAIEAVTARRKDRSMPGLYEVDATRDGDRCREIFLVRDGEDPEDAARRIAAKEFRMDLEDFRHAEDEQPDEDGETTPDYSNFDSECDSFYVEPVDYPEAAAIISDALAELSSGGDFRFGIPHDHPARIKLIAARELIMPKATATDPAA